MQAVYDEIRRLGGDVLVVSFTPPARVAAYLKAHPQPFSIVSDPDLAAYRAFHLSATTFAGFLRPGVLVRYLGWIVRGWRPEAGEAGEDWRQLGGDFVLDAAGRFRFAHASADAADRPPAAALLAAVRAAALVGA